METTESNTKLKVSLKGVKSRRKTLRPYVEPGRYPVTIISVVRATAQKNNKPMLEVQVRVSQNAVITDNMTLVDDFCLGRLRNLCEAVGIDPDDEEGLDLPAFAGKTCDADIENSSMLKRDGDPFSVVIGYLPTSGYSPRPLVSFGANRPLPARSR